MTWTISLLCYIISGLRAKMLSVLSALWLRKCYLDILAFMVSYFSNCPLHGTEQPWHRNKYFLTKLFYYLSKLQQEGMQNLWQKTSSIQKERSFLWKNSENNSTSKNLEMSTFNLLRGFFQYIWDPSYDIGKNVCNKIITSVMPCKRK